MMAMYKLYVIIHRRTDFYEISRKIYEAMYPEYHEEQRRKARTALAELMVLQSMLGGNKYL